MNREIVEINIKDSLDAGKFDKKQLVQKRAISRISELVRDKILRVESIKNESHDEHIRIRSHDTITILGERGTGKTSLLLNIKKFP